MNEIPDKELIPTPASTLIGQFVRQTDGLCGYGILRPEKWTAFEAECRIYLLPSSEGQTNQLILRVANYQVLAQQQTGAMIAQYDRISSGLAALVFGEK